MIILNKTDLFHSLFDAFRQNTNSVYFVGGDNPYQFSFKGKLVTIFVGNIHFAKRADPDEYRIQCPGDLPVTLGNSKLKGDTVLILGFSADAHAFSAWDPDRFLARNLSTQRFSVYTRLSRMQEAAAQGFSTYIRYRWTKSWSCFAPISSVCIWRTQQCFTKLLLRSCEG